RRFDDIARFADIGDFIDQPVNTYSSGMYVRLAFATAINVDPDILVVDEALAVGDEAFQRKCYARIEDIKDKGGTILFVSHGAQTIVQLCDRAMLFDRGEKIMEGRPKTVVSQYQRLVNASAEAAADIRASILALRDAPPEPVAAPVTKVTPEFEVAGAFAAGGAPPAASASNAPDAATPTETAEKDDGLADYFDPNLKSQSTVYLEERGARIRDVRITTLDGKPVNVLRMGKRYVFEYWVDFFADARNVGFGMFVRSVDGLGLAGAQTVFSRAQISKIVDAETVAVVEYEFTASMLPGVYFLTCGLFANSGSEVPHRIIDAIAVRIAPEPDLIAIGRVDIGAAPRIAWGRQSSTNSEHAQ
ncbi:MAG: ABC transporter ATP-binding protein, partial [Proteobacteria bacterium]|nr:ABC transporter ATP-binding protein [Pseudomonadota bacterium]